MKRYFDTVIIGLGLFFLGFGCFLVWERESPRQLVFAAPSDSAVVTPIRLSIESIGLNLPIYSAPIQDGKWAITKEGVSHLSTSPLPGKIGNSVMYGHNWAGLLADLDRVQTGDTISVELSDGNVANYRIHFISIVTPDESHIYGNTPDHRLTIYTCTGFLDGKRLVVTAILEQ
jgi:LPXTG-site transpeptidase (sortase) family protein